MKVPNSISKYEKLFQEFMGGMLDKLDKNSHKDTPTRENLAGIVILLRVELEEFEEQLADNKFDPNSLVELFDVANFAFLAYVALRNDGVKTREELGQCSTEN
jgi:hypothetical protein